MNKQELYSKINNQILAKLEEGTVPWKKSWKVGIPSNYISKKGYRGINFLSLCLKDFSSPYYLTFHQAKQKGLSIKKGSKSMMIIYYKLMDWKTEDEISEEKKIPFIRYSNVFNLEQTDYDLEEPAPTLKTCDELFNSFTVKPKLKHNISRCYYNVNEDYISLPKLSDFASEAEYWSTLFHEMVHFTAHKSRLNREIIYEHDHEKYCMEELIAEIGASYLCSLCGISPDVIDNSSSYINGWMKLSKEKENLFPIAAKEAQKAVDYLLIS